MSARAALRLFHRSYPEGQDPMSFFDKANEPLRRYIYGVAAAILGLLVLTGVLTDELAFAIGGIVSAALIVPAGELARAKVSPTEPYEPKHRAP